MFEVRLEQVCEEINQAFRAQNFNRVEHLLWPALDQFVDMPQLWFYAGNVFFQTGRPSLAVLCFTRCLELDDNQLVLANLGASYRRLNDQERGLMVLQAAIDRDPDFEPALVNYGAMFVNEGCPERGIPALERACELGRARGQLEKGAEWNLGLLYLEAKRFAEGFDIYRRGYGSERLVRNYAYGEVKDPPRLEPEDHAAAVAGAQFGKRRPTLIVWGEQGIGDELMYGTCFNDMIDHYEIVFECHPRLERLHKNSTWANRLRAEGRPVRIFPTRKDSGFSWHQDEQIVADFKCPIADLAAYTRRTAQAFKDSWDRSGPTYSAKPQEVADYRLKLEQMAQGRKIVGLATHGGVLTTARFYRTLKFPEIEHLFKNTECLFVGFDYDNMTPFAIAMSERYPGRYIWFPSVVQHWDFDHTAALLAATDMNVLVCQSAAHLSAGIGQTTRVLAPKQVAWREIKVPELGEDTWYWWPGANTKLYMQNVAGDWTGPLDRVIEDIKAL